MPARDSMRQQLSSASRKLLEKGRKLHVQEIQTPCPSDWLAAAFARFADQGVDSVRVEALARDLGVSKGSFYWHFRDRNDLLDRMLARWEREELEWIEAEDGASPAARWARIVANGQLGLGSYSAR